MMFSKAFAFILLSYNLLLFNLIVFQNESCPPYVVIFYQTVIIQVHLFGSILSHRMYYNV